MFTTPRRRYSSLLALLGAAVVGCGITSDSEERVTLYVAAQTQTCFGPFETQCMLVKERPDAEYELFYHSIEGFTHVAGFTYVLLVAWREVPYPPADGSSRAYRLIRLQSKTPG